VVTAINEFIVLADYLRSFTTLNTKITASFNCRCSFGTV